MSENRLNEGRFVPDSSKNVELKPKLSPTLTHYFEPPCCLEAEINATRVCGLLLHEPFQPTDSRAPELTAPTKMLLFIQQLSDCPLVVGCCR